MADVGQGRSDHAVHRPVHAAGFTYEPVVAPSLNGLLRADIGYGLFEGASC